MNNEYVLFKLNADEMNQNIFFKFLRLVLLGLFLSLADFANLILIIYNWDKLVSFN